MNVPTWPVVRDRFVRTVEWPGGSRIAVSIGVALEAFENQSQVRLAGRPGTADAFSLSYGEYGVRAGVWRLLALLDEFALHASFSISGRFAASWPDVVAAVVGAGHEPVGHGWVNDAFLSEADDDAERMTIRRTLDAIEQAGGIRPTGWASPANSSSPGTKSNLVAEGVRWSGDDASDDLPFVEAVDGRPLAVLPKVNLAANDLIHWVLPTNAATVFEQGFVDCFDTLYAEGRAGSPKWADMVLHCHMAGRPAFQPTLRRVLEHGRSHGDVWWATKGEIAERAITAGWGREVGPGTGSG